MTAQAIGKIPRHAENNNPHYEHEVKEIIERIRIQTLTQIDAVHRIKNHGRGKEKGKQPAKEQVYEQLFLVTDPVPFHDGLCPSPAAEKGGGQMWKPKLFLNVQTIKKEYG